MSLVLLIWGYRERGGGGQAERFWQITDCQFSLKPFCKGEEAPCAGELGLVLTQACEWGLVQQQFMQPEFFSLALEDTK